MANGRRLPFSNSVIIDQADALEWIDQLRVTIPEEIKSARRVTNEVERLLEQAREEAEQILARAQEQATYLIEERELTRQAEELSHEIIRQARLEGDRGSALRLVTAVATRVTSLWTDRRYLDMSVLNPAAARQAA